MRTNTATHIQILTTLTHEIHQAADLTCDLDAVAELQATIDDYRDALDDLVTAMTSRPRPGSGLKLNADRIRALAAAGEDDAPALSAAQASRLVGLLATAV